MGKIDKELNKLLILLIIVISTFFIFLFFSKGISIYFAVNEKLFDAIISIVTLLFLVVAYFKIKDISKKFKTQFNTVVALKEKELIDTNKKLSETNQSLKQQLYVDSLTKLLNRRALERDIKDMSNPKLIILDIDSFKDINEYYGRDIGNLVLSEVALVLKNISKKEKFHLYRIGADEFALLEDMELDIDRYEEIALELVDIFRKQKIITDEKNEPIDINITLGFSFDADNTIEKASIALSEAKSKQINFLCYFKKIDNKHKYHEQIKWSKFIDKAISENRVIPYYQPIFNADKKVLKYECLVRILDTNEEVFPPGLFLDISKKVKKYTEIEKLIIEKSFIEIENTDKIISVNLLARDMSDSDVSNFVISMLKKYNVAKQVIFEILENENIENLDRVAKFISYVRKMGCRIAIDDFGTGYSNFSYLITMKPDYIKIDGSLIKNLEKDENSYAMVSSIIAFAKKLNIKTIAEFVHNEEIFKICKDLGVDEFQGFYLGEPSPKLRDTSDNVNSLK